MAAQNRELYQLWAMRLSMVTTVIVVMLSWINRLSLLNLIVRAGVSFGVMYLLMTGILNLFERTAIPETENSQPDSDSGCGNNIDFSVGDVELLGAEGQEAEFPGQIDRDLSSGLPDSKQQAEIVRRMGWDGGE